MQQRCSAAWMPGRKRAIPSKVRATSQQPRSLRAKSEEQSAKQLKLVHGKGPASEAPGPLLFALSPLRLHLRLRDRL